jgi:hypothetical protein
MKKALFILFFLCFLSGKQAFAQDTLHVAPKQLALTILDNLHHEVSLTENQREEVYALLIERSEKIEKIKSKVKPAKLSKESVKELNQGTYQKLRKVLTEEQWVKMQALREETRRQKAEFPEELVYPSDEDIVLDF